MKIIYFLFFVFFSCKEYNNSQRNYFFKNDFSIADLENLKNYRNQIDQLATQSNNQQLKELFFNLSEQLSFVFESKSPIYKMPSYKKKIKGIKKIIKTQINKDGNWQVESLIKKTSENDFDLNFYKYALKAWKLFKSIIPFNEDRNLEKLNDKWKEIKENINKCADILSLYKRKQNELNYNLDLEKEENNEALIKKGSISTLRNFFSIIHPILLDHPIYNKNPNLYNYIALIDRLTKSYKMNLVGVDSFEKISTYFLETILLFFDFFPDNLILDYELLDENSYKYSLDGYKDEIYDFINSYNYGELEDKEEQIVRYLAFYTEFKGFVVVLNFSRENLNNKVLEAKKEQIRILLKSILDVLNEMKKN
jgi:hypothetical protein